MSFEIVARTAYGTEVVDTADSEQEARTLVREYAVAFGQSMPVWYRETEV